MLVDNMFFSFSFLSLLIMNNSVFAYAEQAEVTAEIDVLRDQLKPKVKELNEMGT